MNEKSYLLHRNTDTFRGHKNENLKIKTRFVKNLRF